MPFPNAKTHLKFIGQNSSGMALTIVVIVVVMLTLLSGYVTQLGYNQRRLMDSGGGIRAKIYYRAQAGVVNANWRIRTDYTVGLAPAGSFATDTYNPNPYSIDIDADGISDVTVDIGPVANAQLKNRPISSTGLDT